MHKHALIFGLGVALAWLSLATAKTPGGVVVLDVEGGDTALAVAPDRMQAWWLKGECRVAIPIDAANSTPASLLSEAQTEVVSLGRRNVRMTQQFRFDITPNDIDVSIYSSVRGGWAAVPTKRDRACEASACRARTELPEC